MYLKITEERGGMLQFALDVESDHARAACALPLH